MSVDDPHTADPLRVTPPRGLRAAPVEINDERYVVVSYPVATRDPLESLTDAERAVVILVLRGLSSEQIAHVRATAVRTVANQLASIYRKLGVNSRVELAARLRDSGTY